MSKEVWDAERAGGKVFVGNLSKGTEKEELQDLFKPYGEVLSVWVAKQPSGFAFVTFKDPRDAQEAVDANNGKETEFTMRGGMRVEISHSRPKPSRDNRGRDRHDSRRRARSRGRSDSPPRRRRRSPSDSRRRGARR